MFKRFLKPDSPNVKVSIDAAGDRPSVSIVFENLKPQESAADLMRVFKALGKAGPIGRYLEALVASEIMGLPLEQRVKFWTKGQFERGKKKVEDLAARIE